MVFSRRRSLALDEFWGPARLNEYGTGLWLRAQHPQNSQSPTTQSDRDRRFGGKKQYPCEADKSRPPSSDTEDFPSAHLLVLIRPSLISFCILKDEASSPPFRRRFACPEIRVPSCNCCSEIPPLYKPLTVFLSFFRAETPVDMGALILPLFSSHLGGSL